MRRDEKTLGKIMRDEKRWKDKERSGKIMTYEKR